jgi:CCR4-NOT transcription complex subunit 1
VQRAILEIISPVVERSVTIAAIATAQLIHKDFAMEADENKVRQSAQTMVKSLAGSLALVTCKEPLRMSMTNYIRVMQQDLPDQALPEGAILMCVNDNLEIACGMVEKAAEQRSMPEIEANIEDQLAARRRHRANRPNEAYIDPMINRWAFFIPEPYRQTPGGLNKEQMAIYEEFTRQSRGLVNHIQTGSTDSGRQLPDVLQETFPSVPSFPTPAETPALPHQVPQQHKQQPRLPPPSVPVSGHQHQVNGFMDVSTLQDRILDLLSELQRVSKEAPEQHVKDLPRESATLDVFNQLLYLLVSAPPYIEQIALAIAQRICVTLYSQTEQALEIEVLVQLLSKLCQISSSTAKEVILWMANTDDERALNVPVTVALLNGGLMEIQRVDNILAKAIQQRKVVAVEFLSNLMKEVLLNERPIGLRADFASSLEAMGLWLAEDPTLNVAQELMRKLKESGVPAYINGEPDERSRSKRQQMEYIFSEWVALCTHSSSTDRTFSAFISQLHQKQIMNTQEESALFFRLCIDASVEMFEREEMDPAGNTSDAYIWIDALAKLIVLLVKYQGEANGAVKGNKPAYLNSILALIVLVLNHHHVMRGERFNQRVFFRLFSSVLCEYHAIGRQGPDQDHEMMLVFANIFLVLQPLYIPGFVYGWLSLVSHRVFMPGLLKKPDEIVSDPADTLNGTMSINEI